MKAMILAAGLGTRLKPWTDHHPKALAQINGKTLLQRNIEYLQSAGIHEVLVNVHHFPDQIQKAIEDNNGWGSNIAISDETDAVLETGGGLQKAAGFFEGEEDLILMNVDILTDLSLAALIEVHKAHGALVTLAVSQRSSSRYFLFDNKSGLLGGWENIQTGEQRIKRVMTEPLQKAFSGIHCINTRLFDWMDQEGKYSIVEVYLGLCEKQEITFYDHTGCRFIDVGKPESLQKAAQLFP